MVLDGVAWLGFFHLNPLLSPHHREERQSLSCCVFVIHGPRTFFTLPELGIFVKQSWATSPWLINIIYFAWELGQIIVIYNRLPSPPHNGKSFFWEMSCSEGSFLEQEPPLLRAAALAAPEPQPALKTSDGAARGNHCCGDTSQLLMGGKSLQDASKIKTVDEAEPPHPQPLLLPTPF